MPVMFLEPLRLALQCAQLTCHQCQLMFFTPWLCWVAPRSSTDDR